MKKQVLVAEALTVQVGGRSVEETSPSVILRDASFKLADGEILGLAGASGSGKSTLLRTLARLSEPQSGRVLLKGRDWNEFTPTQYRRQVCLLPQVPIALPGTVRDNLNFVFHLHRDLQPTDLRNLLGDVNLSQEVLNQPAESLSVGEKQRLALARALALRPWVLLLDEPTSALDQANADQVLDLVANVCSTRSLSAILTSHIRERLRISHRRVLLSDGTVREDG